MTTATTRHADRRISPVFLGIVAVMAVTGWAVWSDFSASLGVAVFLFVTSAWVVSLCLHEYAHARTALHGGDISVGEKGYLTLNPLKYTHALLSIVLPVVFVILGGIGLPGGAVFIERGRIRGRWKHSLISAAGPLTNVLFAVVCTAPFWLDALDGVPLGFRFALAFLALLQVTAAILNFLPVPGLDGYGVIEPWLSHKIRRQVEPYAPFGLLAVFGVLFIPEVNHTFFDAIDAILRGLGVSEAETYCGQDFYRFWQTGGPCESVLNQ
ncbi:site-2 protease family protein [Streptomyces lunaelactis]|uniref:site-2 protease family protein n=1 Tax=Streptomyces lunaelactis TaxID=1535768 RepID=UPI0015850EAD|nr:site-2 protease family protein [Streptomyces lunaelactis]NUK04529.1 site-2 protease family protein [Streptomyces lunaelactis]NUK08492.1 site-2 protease family protein [Streptomyces lunaelactis]NUK18907.1 site-2 protease family protein [Streptomyces lunaelactis]NUK34455.1 site-2 protease family protein [Streptomyces lunaelactis]NUK43649.1 site-2 protease family protein [Streptomyces lunaelactis]